MVNETSAQHSLVELVTSRRHAADFTASRADYIGARLRPLALILAVLLPAWIPVDYMLLPYLEFWPLAALRLAAAGLALTLYFITPRGISMLGALARLAALFAIPTALYLTARLTQGAGGDDMLYGYAFFPVLIAAMLAIFPLTLLEGLVFGMPLLIGYGGLEVALGAPLEARWLGMLWLLSLVELIGLGTQLSQLRMLLDLFGRATRDSITGALNRRSLAERLEAEHARWERHARPMAVLLIELGGLEQIAHKHGHDVANRLLAQLTESVGRVLRPTDVFGRWDADTLLVLLPETDEEAARRLVAKVREVTDLATITAPSGAKVRGEPRLAVAAPAPQESLAALLARVDRKLMGDTRVAMAG